MSESSGGPGRTAASSARTLLASARAWRRAREQRRFHSRLRVDRNAAELLLSPHLDDAVLARWALLQGARDLRVVNVFAGIPAAGSVAAWDAITGARDSAERARERIAEDERALARAGRAPACLGFLDAQYRRPGGAPSVAELDRALAGVVAGASRVHATAGIGGHPDHLLVRRYACLLAAGGMPVSLYAELPYCVRHGWPSWVDGSEPDRLRDVEAFWGEQLSGVAGMPPLRSARVWRLEDEQAAAKLEAMRCYATQLPALDYAARGVLEEPEVLRFEVSWELAGAAQPG